MHSDALVLSWRAEVKDGSTSAQIPPQCFIALPPVRGQVGRCVLHGNVVARVGLVFRVKVRDVTDADEWVGDSAVIVRCVRGQVPVYLHFYQVSVEEGLG